jgi:hypothetical protein
LVWFLMRRGQPMSADLIVVQHAFDGIVGVAAEVAGSLVGLGLDRVRVADGVAVVFPFLVEDHVQARGGGS